ncbi:hypothetical protein BDD12DRAFT_843759 [Trichophaea hybrida]|nr:hypothetical protein BDD12DRAFT_843759 [Trichophaea hybrida]
MFEAQALFPGNPEKDVEDWPLFELTDASVVLYRRGKPEELVDLFNVVEDGPFRLRGMLSPVQKKWKKSVRTPDVYTQPLVIPKVVTYGMEHVAKKGCDTRQTVIWVLGAAAWYSIAPSAEYKPIFEQLVEKARVWLFLQDRYAKFHGKGRPLKGTVMEIYKDFTEYDPKYRTARAASKLFDKHHRYLLFMMMKLESDVEMWKRTPIYLHFKEDFEDSVLEAMRFFGHIKKDKTPPPAPDDSEDEEDSCGADDDDDEDIEERTPEPRDDDDSSTTVGKTVSTKGRSILRPRRSVIPLEPPSPESRLVPDDASPIETRLKRRQGLETITVASGSRLKRQMLSFPSESPPPSSMQYSEPPRSESPVQQRNGKGVHKPNGRLSRKFMEDNTWTCTLDVPRCTHVVTNAKTRDGRHAIEQHYAFHGKIMADAMQTIDMEVQANSSGGYHVSHLMKKIQEMSQKWEQSKPSPLKGLGE